jgi:hypothetical protein
VAVTEPAGSENTVGGSVSTPPTTKAPSEPPTTTPTTATQTTTTQAVAIRPSGCEVTGSVITLEGPQAEQYKNRTVAANTTIDARSASWVGIDDYPVRIRGGENVCWFGGVIEGTYSDATTWDRMHDTAALSIESPNYSVLGVRAHNYGDGINITDDARDFLISGIHLTFIRDDCIENDKLYSGTVENSLLDGCYTAISARRHSGDAISNGTGNDFTIRNSLIRLQPMPTVYKGTAPGHGGLFKWDSISPQLHLHNNVFRVDQLPNGGNLGVPDGFLASCSNNVVVWLGAGDYPDPLPSCFTITTDVSVWNGAVASWASRNG